MANRFTISTTFSAIDHMSTTMDRIGMRASLLGSRIGRVAGGIGRVFSRIGSVALVAGGAVGLAGQQFLQAAGQVEKYKATLETMLGSQEAANARFQEMSRFAASTPFELPQVVQLGNQLQALNRYSLENMTTLGDLAAAAGKPIEQVSSAFSKLASGQRGVAVDMFRDLLITTDDWVKATGKGVTSSGQLLATTEEMIAALPRILEAKGFSGLMERQSRTFEGRMSNMSDAFYQFKAAMGAALLGPVGQVTGKITALVQKMTEWANANGDLISSKVSNFIDAIVSILEKLLPVVGKILSKFGDMVEKILPSLLTILEELTPLFDVLFEIIDAVAPVVITLADAIAKVLGPVLRMLMPVIQVVVWAIKLLAGAFDFAVGAMGSLVAGIANFINGIPGAIIGAWNAVGQFFANLWTSITGAFDRAVSFILVLLEPLLSAIGAIQGGLSAIGIGGPAPALAAGAPPLGGGVTRSITENRSSVDINLRGAPAGSTVRQTGSAPGVRLNMGAAGIR